VEVVREVAQKVVTFREERFKGGRDLPGLSGGWSLKLLL
jgi:hypothetical protein